MTSAELAGPGKLKLQVHVLRLAPERSSDEFEHVLVAALHLPRLTEQQQRIVRIRVRCRKGQTGTHGLVDALLAQEIHDVANSRLVLL